MVKIERLQEWTASDKCLSVMEKRLFINFLQKNFINSTPLYFIVKLLNFLLITCTSYLIKYFTNFLFSPILAYWNRFLKLPLGSKIFS